MADISLIQVSNRDQENYFKFRVNDPNSMRIGLMIRGFLMSLGFDPADTSDWPEGDCQSQEGVSHHAYSDYFERYNYSCNSKFSVHIMLDTNIHIIVKCSESNRDQLIKAVSDHLGWFDSVSKSTAKLDRVNKLVQKKRN